MEEGNTNPATSGSGPSPAQQAQQQQNLLLQQQLFMMQQQQAQQQQQQQQQRPRPLMQAPNLQQSHMQQAMARFPSNIDAHLRAPGFRSLQFAQAQLQQQQGQMPQAQLQQQMARSAAPPAPTVRNPEIEMALQDASKVCNPDVKTPFASIEDAVNRLLPYHVVSDYEAEEDDRVVESDKSGQAPSRLQQWDHNILVKIAEFTSTFEKQVLAFNIMTRKRSLGEFRSEERLHLEQSLLHNEKRIALETRADIEARQKAAAQMAASAMQADMMGPTRPPAPMRGHAASVHGEDTHDQEAMRHGGWAGNASSSGVNSANANENENGDNDGEEEEDGDEDFLNNEENGEDEDDESGGELDLNVR